VITPGPPIQRLEWNKKPVDNSQIPELLSRIAELKQKNLTGEAVVFDWMKRRIQPLQAWEMLSFQYQGTTNSSRFSEEEISSEEVFSRIQRMLRNVKKVPIVPDAFSAANPPKQV
jgi:DNA polymerase III delta prime subunit